MNAIEHGSSDDSTNIIHIQFCAESEGMEVIVLNKGASFELLNSKPDIGAKIEGKDRARGWGLFLIRSLADAVEIGTKDEYTFIKIRFKLKHNRNSS